MMESETRPALPLMLSLNAGYVDTAGFLALHGLFAAHVTGNFVTLGASLALGTSGATSKLLALPVFCLVVLGGRVFHYRLIGYRWPILRSLLLIMFMLFCLAAALAMSLGPFADGDG